MQESRPNDSNPEKPVKSGFSLLQIEKWLQGELSQEEQERIREAAEKSPQLAAYLQRAKAWNEEANSLQLPSRVAATMNSTPSKPVEWMEGFKHRLRSWGKSVTQPNWGLSGLALASMVILVGVVTFTVRQNQEVQAGYSNTKGDLTPKGVMGTGIRLDLSGRTYASGTDIPVNTGDTLRIVYRSMDSVFFQLWCMEENGKLQALHREAGERLPGSSRWIHSGKSLVIDSEVDCRQIQMIWTGAQSELTALEKSLKKGDPLPTDQAAIFKIHFAATK